MVNPALETNKLRLYVILDLSYCNNKNILDIANILIKEGVRTLQLRGKDVSTKELFLIGKDLRKITREAGVNFIINDRADLCMVLEADGVHLGQLDLPVDEVRKLIGQDKIIGISTHSIKEINHTNYLDVDYISIGPIFKTTTKPDLPSLGVDILDKLPHDVKKPLIAIGGISSKNINKLYGKNLSGIAVISAILSSDDVGFSTRELFNKINKL